MPDKQSAFDIRIGSILVGFIAIAACSAPVAEHQTQTIKEIRSTETTTPLIIAHRGASGDLPEHTIEAYLLAIEQGADYIEPDLVMTKDGILIARHDLYLSTTTNVSELPQYANRRRTNPAMFGGLKQDWWAEDFTLAEIKTLRARQPRKNRSAEFDDLYTIPSFDEVVALAADHEVGIYPETKSPSHHASIGLDMKDPLLAALNGHPGDVFIQSFEAEILVELDQLSDWPLVQLLSGRDNPPKEPNLQEIARYADGVGPYKLYISSWQNLDDYIRDAHQLGLVVHPYTFRADDLPDDMTFEDELLLYFAAGVDGLFTDHPGLAVTIRDNALKEQD